MEYKRDIFSAATVRKMLDHYILLLNEALNKPAVSLLGCSQLSPAELARLKSDFTRALVLG
jgi:hypothetical protein